MNETPVNFVYKDNEPQRLDKFLVTCLPEFSRARIQQYIKTGHVLINQKPAHKAGQSLEKGMLVSISIPPIEPNRLVPEDIPLEIVFENNDIIVVNKPSGMVVHPSAGHNSGTLVHAALAHTAQFEGVGGVHRPGIVHRLDKDTSGIILLAKNDHAHQFLSDQFRNREVRKVYLALVDGQPPTATGRVEAAIGRDSGHRKRMAITTEIKGRAAISEYRTIKNFTSHTLLKVYPLTGRTHQIRVHLAFLKCPVVGDTLYGRKKPTIHLNRHFLHAYRLSIMLPGESQPCTFKASLPDDLNNVLDNLS